MFCFGGSALLETSKGFQRCHWEVWLCYEVVGLQSTSCVLVNSALENSFRPFPSGEDVSVGLMGTQRFGTQIEVDMQTCLARAFVSDCGLLAPGEQGQLQVRQHPVPGPPGTEQILTCIC